MLSEQVVNTLIGLSGLVGGAIIALIAVLINRRIGKKNFGLMNDMSW